MLKTLKYFLFGLFLHFFSPFSFGQNKTESFKNSKQDTATVNALLKLSKRHLAENNFDSCLAYAGKVLTMSEAIHYNEGIASAYLVKGNAYLNLKTDIITARKFFTQGKEIAETLGNKKILYKTFSGIALTYQDEGKHGAALEYFLKALRTAETAGNKKMVASAHHNIGVNYAYRNDYSSAIKEYFGALKIYEELKDTIGLCSSYFVIGIAYSNIEPRNISLATEYQLKRINLLNALHDTISVAYSYNEIAAMYGVIQKPQKSLEYCFKALAILKNTNEFEGISNTYSKIASFSYSANQYENILKYANEGLVFAKQIRSLSQTAFFYKNLSVYYAHKKDYQNAYSYFQLSAVTKDSMTSEESAKQIAEMQTKYETEKKEQEIVLLNKEKEKEAAVAKEKNHKQQIILLSVAGGLLLVLVFALFIYRSLKTTRRQKMIIEEKQKEILDSIQYARRIQTSLLPTHSYISKTLDKLLKK